MIQQANPLAAFAQGQQLGQQMQETRRQNALFDLYRDQGAGIASGDPAALAQLAQMDPMAAMQITRQNKADAFRREQFDYRKGRDAKADARQDKALQLRLEEFKRTASAQEQAAAAADAERIVAIMSAAQTPEQWDELAAQYGANEYVGQFANREALQNQFLTVAEVLRRQAGQKPADAYERYVAEEEAKGTPAENILDRIQYAQAIKGNGFSVTTPDGTRVQYGGSSDTSESPLQPSSPSAMLASIDGILSDPALETATGVFSFLQNVPGTPQKRFGTRAKQLEGQAFLQAFESLKGGGQITEIEGQKATQAIGRLDTAQSPADYRAALEELRGILAEGLARPKGWVEQQKSRNNLSVPIPAGEANSMTVEQIGAMTIDDINRLPVTELDFTPEQWDALERRAEQLDSAQ